MQAAHTRANTSAMPSQAEYYPVQDSACPPTTLLNPRSFEESYEHFDDSLQLPAHVAYVTLPDWPYVI